MRLIDADALLNAYGNIDWYTVHKTGYMTQGSTSNDNPVIHYYDGEEVIKNAPTIDAVPVVRCKDCICYTPVDENTGKCVFFIRKHQYVAPDGYCYLGERKEGAE